MSLPAVGKGNVIILSTGTYPLEQREQRLGSQANVGGTSWLPGVVCLSYPHCAISVRRHDKRCFSGVP